MIKNASIFKCKSKCSMFFIVDTNKIHRPVFNGTCMHILVLIRLRKSIKWLLTLTLVDQIYALISTICLCLPCMALVQQKLIALLDSGVLFTICQNVILYVPIIWAQFIFNTQHTHNTHCLPSQNYITTKMR